MEFVFLPEICCAHEMVLLYSLKGHVFNEFVAHSLRAVGKVKKAFDAVLNAYRS